MKATALSADRAMVPTLMPMEWMDQAPAITRPSRTRTAVRDCAEGRGGVLAAARGGLSREDTQFTSYRGSEVAGSVVPATEE